MLDKALWGFRCAVEHCLLTICFSQSLIFFKTTKSSNNLLWILNVYAQASGLCINMEKTTMDFSNNVGETIRNKISAMWCCEGTTQYERYFGLPHIIGHYKKKKPYSKIKMKLWQRFQT